MRSGDRPRDRVTEEETLIFLTAVAGRSRVVTGGSRLLLPLTQGQPVLVAQNFSSRPLYLQIRTNQLTATFRVGNDGSSAISGSEYVLTGGDPESFVPFVLLQGERIFAVNPLAPIQQIVASQLVL